MNPKKQPAIIVVPMTAIQYLHYFGKPAYLDDLDRVNCVMAGEPTHRMCGICREHHQPRFACGCIQWEKEPTS